MSVMTSYGVGKKGKNLFVLAIIMLFLTTFANVGHAAEVGDEVERSLHGTITDAGGNPIEGAEIEVGSYTSDGPYGYHALMTTTTDENGEYDITFTKKFGDPLFVILRVQGFVIVNDLQSDSFDFQMPVERATVSGKVTFTDEFETPIGDYPLSLYVYLGHHEGWIKIADTTTDSEGNYSFSTIPGEFYGYRGPNNYSLMNNDDLTYARETNVELHLGDQKTVNLQEWDVYPGALNTLLNIEVVDESNAPIGDAIVNLTGTEVTLTEPGAYFSSGVIKGGLYTLDISASGFETYTEEILLDGGTRNLTVTLYKNDPPIVTALVEREPDYNGWYNENVYVYFDVYDSDSANYSVDPPVLVATEGMDQVITGAAVDDEEAIGTASVNISLDKTAPLTIALISESASSDHWYNTDVHVSLQASDNLSGIEQTEYSLDSGLTWIAYEGAITLASEGEQTLQYRSMDQAGNREETKQLEMNIDKTAPSLIITLTPDELTPAKHQMKEIHAEVQGVDEGSGVAFIQLTSITFNESDKGSKHAKDSKNKKHGEHALEDIQNADYGTYDTVFDLLAESSKKDGYREYTVTYTVMDKAGNTAAASAIVTVPAEVKADKGKDKDKHENDKNDV
ncbi:carboxypeptidase-like regulatory domain-containing protein [Paenibacillus sp. HB172176]|uniref:carboxypeptidase-like regulatory domain-containing protein n=1 Tax=Paenibacillus sp. HB172176 TaxID=2493690 RepID=UPI0014394246|nr:carboxypeptidase-like regulatory domain-containing protein [Paenibacillus sp. HB172176]